MLMKEELAQRVIDGTKRQTRRPIKDGDMMSDKTEHLFTKTVIDINGRVKYQVGREYSLQYGRGLPTRMFRDNDAHLLPLAEYLKYRGMKGDYNGVAADVLSVNEYIPLKIKLLDIWAEDVRTINYGSSLAEGFSCADEFLVTWCNFYDAKLNARWLSHEGEGFVLWNNPKTNGSYISRDIEGVRNPVENFSTWLIHNRPDNTYAYHAWALKFEVVR
jgi:hypothetical protein